MAIGRGLFYLVKFISAMKVIHNSYPKFHERHEGFSFYGPRKPDKGADMDIGSYKIFADLMKKRGLHTNI